MAIRPSPVAGRPARVLRSVLSQAWTPTSVQTVDVAQVEETDTALAVAVNPRARLINPLEETDLAQAVTAKKTLAIGLLAETETAQPITVRKTVAIGLTTETDTVHAHTSLKVKALGLTEETDTAPLQTALKTQTLGLTEETELAQAMTAVQSSVAVPLVVRAIPVPERPALVRRSVLYQALTPSTAPAPIQQATETDEALPITASKTATLGLTAESDTAQSATGEKQQTLGQSIETDAVFGLARLKVKVLGFTTEAELAQTLTGEKQRLLGLAEETDEAMALAVVGASPVIWRPVIACRKGRR